MTAPRKSSSSSSSAKQSLFLPYQRRWIEDTSRLKIMQKSRQIGISWSTAYALVRRKALAEARQDAWVSSRDEIQARLFLEDCKSFAGILNAGAQDLGERVVDEDRRISAYVLEFANRLRIHSMSSNPDAQAGKRGDRVLDEFALHPDPRKLYSIAYPGITWGGALEIVSTHRGTANFFNQLIQEVVHKGNPKGFSLHTVTLQTALEEGFLAKLKAKLPADDARQAMDDAAYFDFIRRGCPDEETFLQEYMCQPADDATAFLPYDLLVPCEYAASEQWETDLEDCHNPLYIGVDVGRQHDLTVIWVLELVGGVRLTRRVICMQNATFAAQEERLWNLLRLPQVRRCCIDKTGIGMQFTERASDRFGYKVEGVTFTQPVKEALAFPVRAAFEDRSVRIPADPAVRSDLRAIKRETTAAGNIRFSSDRGPGGHADRFWALALALHSIGNGSVPSMPQAFNTRRGRALAARRTREVFA